MATFRLDLHPWIPVVTVDGSANEINLKDVFIGASGISSLAGSPLEVAAVSRFLLAIAHLTETPTSLQQWFTLWNNRDEYMRRCAGYVEAQSDAWDFFHEIHPFGQLPDIHKTINPAHILLYDAARKNNAVFIDHRIEDDPAAIDTATVVRGMLVTNAYAGSSGGGYRSGPLAMRSTAMLCGPTLDTTLLLNLLVQPKQPLAYDWRTYGHLLGARDSGTGDLPRRYLWTSRSVRVIGDTEGTSAATIMLAPGNDMPESERPHDPMVVVRKDSKGTAYVPLRLEANRALWRSAHVLLNRQQDTRPLEAVSQLDRLISRGYISTDESISMRVCAVAGDAQGPSTELWRDESLPFGLSVIADNRRYASLLKAINSAKEAASSVRNSIYSFAARYLQNGMSSTPDKKDVARLADELSVGLAGFWAVIAPAGERIACDGFDEVQWLTLLRQASSSELQRAIDRLPPDARRHRAEFANRSKAQKRKGVSA